MGRGVMKRGREDVGPPALQSIRARPLFPALTDRAISCRASGPGTGNKGCPKVAALRLQRRRLVVHFAALMHPTACDSPKGMVGSSPLYMLRFTTVLRRDHPMIVGLHCCRRSLI